MKYIFLFFSLFLFASAKMYRDGNLEVVIDDKSKLMWLDSVLVVKTLKSHEDALKYCNEINHAGYSNWRLAKIEELETIVDKRNTKNFINKAFKYNVPDGYWASKAHVRTLLFYADYMHFVSGTPYYDNRKTKKYVRCVRDN